MNNPVFKNRYLSLGQPFYRKVRPTPVTAPSLIRFNSELGADLGIQVTDYDETYLAGLFSGNRVHESCEPLAMAYAGHQFGHYNPRLGDGRAIYLGELDLIDGGSLDIQLKGSGVTPYSRNGDGRAALGPVLREYLVSEAMYRLGLPTTRALAAVKTGDRVVRERFLPGAIITRAATSLIRVGSFQYFSTHHDECSVKALADYVIERTYPDLADADNPYQALFEEVVLRQASLIARWVQIGFIHGVMNTDNMSIAGETIDYGPCAFMDFYNNDQVYSSIDRYGRYAYGNQPNIGLWNLSRLAEVLLPLFDSDTHTAVKRAQDTLQQYIDRYRQVWQEGFMAKCGLSRVQDTTPENDQALLESLLGTMADNQADFTLTFRSLSNLNREPDQNDQVWGEQFMHRPAAYEWLSKWRQRLALEPYSDTERQYGMRAVNPVLIPRNHQIEAVIHAAEDLNDFVPFHRLFDALQNPYQECREQVDFLQPPKPDEVVPLTFCGT